MKKYEKKIQLLERRLEKQKLRTERPSIKDLKKELRRVTHRIVRYRYDSCFSCGKYLEFEKRQAGHFFTDAGNPGTRYDWDNIRTQCQMCNYHKGGDAPYAARLLQEIGQERFLALDLNRKGKSRWTREELETMIEDRKQMLAALE